jgi:hypothetical protein
MRFGKRGRHEPDDQASNQHNLFCVRSNRNFVPGALKETTLDAGRDPDLILVKKNLSLPNPGVAEDARLPYNDASKDR